MSKSYVPFAVVVAVTVAATAGIMAWSNSSGGKNEESAIVDGIERIGKLVTVEYHMSAQVLKTKGKAWYEWKNAKYFAVASGTVTGSLNIKKASINMSEDGVNRLVTITFPPGALEVSKPYIKPGDIICKEISDPNVFHKLKDADYDQARDEALESMTRVARENGIEERTMERAEVLLREWLTPMGYRLRVNFQSPGNSSQRQA